MGIGFGGGGGGTVTETINNMMGLARAPQGLLGMQGVLQMASGLGKVSDSVIGMTQGQQGGAGAAAGQMARLPGMAPGAGMGPQAIGQGMIPGATPGMPAVPGQGMPQMRPPQRMMPPNQMNPMAQRYMQGLVPGMR